MSDPQDAHRTALQACARELDRVTTRLGHAPERHWENNAALVRACSAQLRAIDLALGADGPTDLPVIAARAAAAQLTVITRDLMETARQHEDGAPSLLAAADLLAALRRELP